MFSPFKDIVISLRAQLYTKKVELAQCKAYNTKLEKELMLTQDALYALRYPEVPVESFIAPERHVRVPVTAKEWYLSKLPF